MRRLRGSRSLRIALLAFAIALAALAAASWLAGDASEISLDYEGFD